MARDDLVAGAMGEAAPVLGGRGARSLAANALGLRTAAELLPDPLRDHGVPDRIEPDVRVVRRCRASPSEVEQRAPPSESVAASSGGWKPWPS